MPGGGDVSGRVAHLSACSSLDVAPCAHGHRDEVLPEAGGAPLHRKDGGEGMVKRGSQQMILTCSAGL